MLAPTVRIDGFDADVPRTPENLLRWAWPISLESKWCLTDTVHDVEVW